MCRPKCTPHDTKCAPYIARARVNLGTILLGGLDLDIYLNRLSMVTTKEKLVYFFDQKSATQSKSWLCLCLNRTVRDVARDSQVSQVIGIGPIYT